MKLNNELSKTRRYVFDEKTRKGIKFRKKISVVIGKKYLQKPKSLGIAEKDYIKTM